jgi:carbamoyltransferase
MILGINGLNHDASMALVSGSDILWAGHSERYSRIKNTSTLSVGMVKELLRYGTPESIVWFEKPIAKSLRKLYSGERPWTIDVVSALELLGLGDLPIQSVGHHESHAAAGFYTSGYADASVLVVDAIGEWNTVTIWQADERGLHKQWSRNYPHSMGLFYSAFTKYLGLKPNEEEYILMGMSAYGHRHPALTNKIKQDFFKEFSGPDFTLQHNLHRGCRWWELPPEYTKFDLAASVQSIMEEYLLSTTQWMRQNMPSNNLVFMGGCALNCVANTRLARESGYDNVWIMPNPGDSGSAIGAVAAVNKQQLNWQGPYLGTDIDRELDVEGVVEDLLAGKVVAVANGRAEFGPRALGNRSLLCDPRGKSAKDLMNTIKKRELFRPFAPAVLAEHADEYFDMPIALSPYMQFVAECRDPSNLPGICHVDTTSRVQTVSAKDNPKFRQILELWYDRTGCPMLMNTSLNIKGQPLVNSLEDATAWEHQYGIKVY